MVMPRRQTLVQLSDELVAALDERAGRAGTSRSELIRLAIVSYLGTGRDAEIDAAIVEGYTRIPPEDDPSILPLLAASMRSLPW